MSCALKKNKSRRCDKLVSITVLSKFSFYIQKQIKSICSQNIYKYNSK